MKEKISEIWCSVLEIDSIGEDERFYDLGGNSISMIIILDEIKKEYGVSLPTKDLYSFDTINKMVQLVEKNMKNEGE